jgi:hypothetical protein
MYGQGVVDGVEKENVGDQRRASEIAALCARDMAAEGVTEMVADYSIWDDGSDGTNTVDFFLNAGIDMIKCVKHTANGRKSWSRILELLGERDELGQPYLRIFSTCKYLIREIETIQCDKNDPEKVDTKQADHALDALLYALTSELYEGNSKNYEPLISGGAKTGYMFNPLESGYWKNRRAF